jgi:predicted ester cyclase
MAAETMSLIERWLRAGDAGDFDVFDEVLHSDVIVHAPLGLSTNGREAEKDVWRNGLVSIPDLHHDVQEVIKDGSTIAARVVVTGTLVRDFAGIRPNGRPFEIDQVVFAHLRDGKAEEIWEIADIGRLVLGDSPTVT